jgi:hypothetical protein
MLRIIPLLGSCLGACGHPDPTSPATSPTPAREATGPTEPPRLEPPRAAEIPRPPGIQRDGFWTLADAPSPAACATDADCIGDTVPAEDLCCQDAYKLAAHSRSWREHIRQWRTRTCGGHVCPPPPNPSQPNPCAFAVRCEVGRCMDSCPTAPTTGLIEIPGGLLDGVRIEPFFIDRTETTVRAYTACVERGACRPAGTGDKCSYNVPGREEYPINCVDQAQAAEYCAWAGKRLPDGLQWSWVARGREENRPFPWGAEPPTCERLKVSFGIPRRGKPCDAHLRPVASLPANASRDGVLDMQGNVEEWMGDPPRKLPHGLNEPYGLLKGISAMDDFDADRVDPSFASYLPARSQEGGIGFRCARERAPILQ